MQNCDMLFNLCKWRYPYYKKNTCTAQLGMTFQLLIKDKLIQLTRRIALQSIYVVFTLLIVGILTFMNRWNLIICWDENDKKFITSGLVGQSFTWSHTPETVYLTKHLLTSVKQTWDVYCVKNEWVSLLRVDKLLYFNICFLLWLFN